MEVSRSIELDRILRLPRRPGVLPSDDDVERLSRHLASPVGTMTLKPIQAQALAEAYNTGTLVGKIVPGGGKALLSFLLPRVLNAKRTLLLIPAQLRKQTFSVAAQMSLHWVLPRLYEADPDRGWYDDGIHVLSYQLLSSVRFADYLDRLNPDLIVADEAHFLSPKAARSKRVFRFLRKKKDHRFVHVRFVPLSGTMDGRSILNQAPLLAGALGERTPLPNHYPTLIEWHLALDEGVKVYERLSPGALGVFCSKAETAEGLHGVRCAVRRRMVETPGVVASRESDLSIPLTIQARETEVPEVVKEAVRVLRETYTLPNGEEVDSPMAAWAHLRSLATGFYYEWDPAPPKEWLQARNAWARFVRGVLARGTPNLDTPLQVANAVQAGRFGTVPEWNNWDRLRSTFKTTTKPRWLSPYLIEQAEDWALSTGGVVWLSHSTAFTHDENGLGSIFKRIPYFGAGKAGEGLLNHKGPCAASIRARGTGHNLTQWDRALILSPPSSGAVFEQLLARHHRVGQTSDLVQFDVCLHSKENYEAFARARREAHYAEALSGTLARTNAATLLASDGGAFDDLRYLNLMRLKDPMWG